MRKKITEDFIKKCISIHGSNYNLPKIPNISSEAIDALLYDKDNELAKWQHDYTINENKKNRKLSIIIGVITIVVSVALSIIISLYN